MDNLIAAGKIKPFAIVMGNGMVKQRIDGELKLNRALYGQMLVEEILPMIEKKNISLAEARKKRGMAGLSMGSVQTTRIICEHPELFSEVGIFSGFFKRQDSRR